MTIKVKGTLPISISNVITQPPPILNHTKLYQRRRVEGRGRRRSEDVRGRREEVQESQGPGSKGSKFQVSQVPRYLKVKFKYKLDSKEGTSCFVFEGSKLYYLVLK